MAEKSDPAIIGAQPSETVQLGKSPSWQEGRAERGEIERSIAVSTRGAL